MTHAYEWMERLYAHGTIRDRKYGMWIGALCMMDNCNSHVHNEGVCKV